MLTLLGLNSSEIHNRSVTAKDCIKPVKVEERKPNKGKGIIEIEDSSVDLTPKYEKAKITLNDCLACSGCITSAEVVLVNQQSLDQFCRLLKENQSKNAEDQLVVVLSLSTQSVLSLAARYSLSPQECTEKIVGYFKKLGVSKVFDINFARCFSIIEAQKEFVHRYKHKDESSLPLPLLASACPGWVCYAEKTHGSYILPYISKTRSPQQVMGAIVKDRWAKQMALPPNKIYHATLMPCFDKKLEASRDEFYNSDFDTRDVDCVITSVEVEQLFNNENVDFPSVEGVTIDPEFSLSLNLSTHDGSGSGGYAHHVFCYAAKHLFGIEAEALEWKSLRNNDMQELTLEVNGESVLKFAIANGFRNIQNLVQKLKRKKSPYHYVEVMACPSGCLNGGAQIRPTEESGKSSKELTLFLESMYKDLPKLSPSSELRVQELYSEWIGSSDDNFTLLHTTYKEVEKSNNPLGIKW